MKETTLIDYGNEIHPKESKFFEELMFLLNKYDVNITLRMGNGFDENAAVAFEFEMGNSIFVSDNYDIYPKDHNVFISDYDKRDMIGIKPIS